MIKKLTKSILFMIIALALFVEIQSILTRKNMATYTYMLNGLKAIPENTIDVRFLGTSHMANGVSPMQIYKSTGICSYDLGASAQPIDTSYYILKKHFRHKTPSSSIGYFRYV